MIASSTESEFLRHEPCNRCSSSDACGVYSDGHRFCFSCGYWQPPPDDFMPEDTAPPKAFVNYDGFYAPIKSRGLHEDTLRKYNVKISADGKHVQFPYYSSNGRLVAYKKRSQDKEFSWVGKNEDQQLFGQHLFGGGKTLVICEGELDCCATWQARKNWPCVSVPNGAKGAKKALTAQLKWLQRFDEVILMFDNDAAGIEASEECAYLFGYD